jgi:hypothetical protein
VSEPGEIHNPVNIRFPLMSSEMSLPVSRTFLDNARYSVGKSTYSDLMPSKVKLSRYVMKATKGREDIYSSDSFLTSALDGGEW